ncbi:hypothetical protein [Bacillus cereus group sp. BfR-BA-01383]|nr:hypothetical protein [Bacillus cereus group sp. BfR-BA-01383]
MENKKEVLILTKYFNIDRQKLLTCATFHLSIINIYCTKILYVT